MLWNRTIQADSSLSKERKGILTGLILNSCKHGTGGLNCVLVVWFHSPAAVQSKSGIKTNNISATQPFCKSGTVREQKGEYSMSLKVSVVLLLGL